MPRPVRLPLLASSALLALAGCGGETTTPVELCTALLATKLPNAEVAAVATIPPAGLELTYTMSSPDGALDGRLVCEIERSALGGPRLRAASLDGRPLSDTELVVRNANLLLDELYALGRSR